jgi:hypothetical protein
MANRIVEKRSYFEEDIEQGVQMSTSGRYQVNVRGKYYGVYEDKDEATRIARKARQEEYGRWDVAAPRLRRI